MRAFKLMLLGEIGVGKTSIANRLVFDRFDLAYKPTIGVDVFRCNLTLKDGKPITLIVWDTDGNFGDTVFRHVYLKHADAALIISDATRTSTLDAMRSLAKGFLDARPGRYCALVVNKLDLVSDREAKGLVAEIADIHLPLVLTSAKTGMNVVDAFQDAAAAIARRSL